MNPWRLRARHVEEPRADLRDRAGRGQARLRLLLRAPPADRPRCPGRRRSLGSTASASHRGQHLREMLDELGPTFVKFGQLLSTRPDIVPPDIIVELRKLQDDVTPVPFAQVEQVVQAELGLPIERLFLEFSERPIAAASIGQVHDAMLPNGRRVAVKVQRPNAPRQIEADLALLYQAARIAKERVRALDFVDARSSSTSSPARFARSSTTAHEARNAQAFHRNFAGDRHVRDPARSSGATRGARVLTLEFLDGTQLQRRRSGRVLAGGPAPARVPDGGGVDDDDLPARRSSTATRIRRTCSSSGRTGSASSTSGSPGSSPTTT